jgi:type IV pilus assembly protein PilC
MSSAEGLLLFAPRIPMPTLAAFCRSMGTMLDSGIDVRRTIQIATKKTLHSSTKNVLLQVVDEINEGQGLADAMKGHGQFFPNLFLDMVTVGEEAGSLPEVLIHLADHYDNNITMKREFISQITWPAIQFVLANFIIAFLIYILGTIAESGTGMDLTAITFGLGGSSGAFTWLCISFGSIAALYFGYLWSNRLFGQKRVLDQFLMKIPVIGHCMRCFAVSRFSWAYYLTQQSGMPVLESVQASCKATANGLFLARRDQMCFDIREGATFTEAVTNSDMFPIEFVEMVSVGEESGTVPETLHRLGPQFENDARRSLKRLTGACSMLTWLCVATFIVIFVFRVALFYIGMINDAAKEF